MDPTILLVAILVDLFIIAACAVIGSSKGRTGEGVMFGILLSVIGLVIMIFLPKAPPYTPQPPPIA